MSFLNLYIRSCLLVVLVLSGFLVKAEDSLIPVVYYTPETGVAGGVIYLQRFGETQDGKTSGIRYIGIYTQNSQSIAIIRPDFWFKDGEYNISADLSYEDFPSRFFGIGNETRREDFEPFSERSNGQKVKGAWRAANHIYLHLGLSRNHRELYKVKGGEKLEQLSDIDSNLGIYTLRGHGAGLSWDDRDLALYPSKGGVHKFSYWDYEHENYDFSEWQLDFRQYASADIGLVGKVIGAIHLNLGELQGEENRIPFQSLLKLGGNKLLRGFYDGRFSDRARGSLQMEVRKKWDKWGMGLFLAVGKVAPSVSDLDGAKKHVGVGAGAHYFVGNDGTSIRFDVGNAEGETSFYFVLDQSF